MSNNNDKVNCIKCRHYAITWNQEAPKACRLLGFKSANMPSAVVYETTGKICEGFAPKAAQKSNPGGNEGGGASPQGVIVSISSKKERK